MGEWQIGLRGFRLSIRTRGHAARIPDLAPGAVEIAKPPADLGLRNRGEDIDAGVRDYESFAEGAVRARSVPPGAGLAERARAVSWYHTIELPEGVVTPGFYDHRGIVSMVGLPEDLHGSRCLDVATFDGYWAFELERRGGDVVALDLPDVTQVDMPQPVRQRVERSGISAPTGAGFDLAHAALQSRVRRVTGSIYDLDPAELGSFDLVHLGDVLLHLENPLRALQRLRAVTSGRAVIVDCFDPELAPGRRLTTYRGGWHNWTWWLPGLDTLGQMIVDAGYDDVTLQATYRLAPAGGGPGHWHAVFHAGT